MEEDARRSLRGDFEPPIVPNESEELRELRKFEEEAFPKGSFKSFNVQRPLGEGAPPTQPPLRVGPDGIPDFLRTPPLQRPQPMPAPQPPEWFLKLKMPNIPVRWDPKVQAYLDWFRNTKAGRAVMRRWLARQGRYRHIIEAAAKRHGLPTDIMYVAMIESGYEPNAVSRVGATGMWQFMARTGRVYGLEIDHWHDDRRDPERSTEAAMHFWKDLYTRFGSWHLALAAYHAGYVAILKSIVLYNTNDYWELCRHENGLPHETTLYVPKAIAAAIIWVNREAFGFGDVTPEPPFAYERVRVPNSTSLAAIARAAGVSESEVKALNPELRRGRTPPGPWDVKLPQGSAQRFARNWATTRKEWDGIDTYVVRFGERLDDIAQKYKTTVKELKKLNGLEETADVRAGVTMLVPKRSPEELKRAEAEMAEREDRLVVAVPDSDAREEGRDRVFYRVREGDTLEEILRVFNVAAEDLARWNALDLTVKVQPGMVLQLFVPKDFDRSRVALLTESQVKPVTLGSQEFLEHVALERGRHRLLYVCRKGDTLDRIGRRFKLTVGQMARINQMPRNAKLNPGQTVVVYAPEPTVSAPRAQARKGPPQRVREAGGRSPHVSAHGTTPQRKANAAPAKGNSPAKSGKAEESSKKDKRSTPAKAGRKG